MLLRIVRHELRTLAADRTLGWTTLVFLAIVGYALWNGSAWAGRQRSEAEQGRAAYGQRIAELRGQLGKPAPARGEALAVDPRAPRTLGGIRQDVFLPPTALAALSIGQGDVLPTRIGINIWTARRMLTRNHEIENPLNLLAGRFDISFAVIYLFPLLMLALSYDLLSSEREQGTLALLLAQPVALRTVVWGKVASRLIVALGLGVGLSLLGILAASRSSFAPGTGLRLGMWVLVVVLYGSFWFGLAALVSALGRSSAASAVLLASAWLGLVVVLPSLLNLAVTQLHPLPSRTLLVHAMREAANEADRNGSRILEKYVHDHPELSGGGPPALDDFTARRISQEQDVEARVAPILDRHDEALAAQQRMVSRLRFLSPAIAVQEALNDIAGTGHHRQRLFLDQAWEFAKANRVFFVPRIFRRESLTDDDYDTLPQFDFRDESSSAVAIRALNGVATIPLAACALGWLAVGRLRSYPVAR